MSLESKRRGRCLKRIRVVGSSRPRGSIPSTQHFGDERLARAGKLSVFATKPRCLIVTESSEVSKWEVSSHPEEPGRVLLRFAISILRIYEYCTHLRSLARSGSEKKLEADCKISHRLCRVAPLLHRRSFSAAKKLDYRPKTGPLKEVNPLLRSNPQAVSRICRDLGQGTNILNNHVLASDDC